MRCPNECSRGGRAGSYPSHPASQQLGYQWRSHAVRNEANIIGLQDEEASHSSACPSPAERPNQRTRRLSVPPFDQAATRISAPDGNPSVADIRRRLVRYGSRSSGFFLTNSTARMI